MEPRPILVTGVSGFIGASLARSVSQQHPCIGLYNQHKPQEPNLPYFIIQADICNQEQVNRIISEIAPEFVIHCAAVSDIKTCAANPAAAENVNICGTENIAIITAKIGAKLIYVSTDLVFDGERGGYVEDDIPNPVCVYGRTKYQGEQIVKSVSRNYCIARSSLVFGFGEERSCFAEYLINMLHAGHNVQLFNDEYRSPIYLPSLCDGLIKLATNNMTGIYHLCGNTRISRLDFGRRLADIFGFRKELLRSISYKDISFNDSRPHDCSMCNTKAIRDLHLTNLYMEESLSCFFEQYKKNHREADIS